MRADRSADSAPSEGPQSWPLVVGVSALVGLVLVLQVLRSLRAGTGIGPAIGLLASVVGMVALILGGSWLQGRHQRMRWEAATTAVGFSPAEPTERDSHFAIANRAGTSLPGPVAGRRGRHAITIRAYYTSALGTDNRETAVEIALPDADPGFTLHVARAGLGARLAAALGAEDVEVGDPAFDRAFRIGSTDAARARRALSPSVREAVLALPKGAWAEVVPAVVLEDGSALEEERRSRVADAMAALGVVEPALPPVALLRVVRFGVGDAPEAIEPCVAAAVALADAISATFPRGYGPSGARGPEAARGSSARRP